MIWIIRAIAIPAIDHERSRLIGPTAFRRQGPLMIPGCTSAVSGSRYGHAIEVSRPHSRKHALTMHV